MDKIELTVVAGIKKAAEILDYWYRWIELEKKEWVEMMLRP